MTLSPAIAPRRVMRGEGGFILIEILVSALILVTVSLAVFLTLDQADKGAGTQQRRSLAANFAQSEIERLRSLPVEDIAAARGTRTVAYGGPAVGSSGSTAMTFDETITAKWVSDGKDEPECTSRSGGLDYLRLTVEVGWKGQGNAKNVKTTSYYTPSAGAGGGDTGSLSVLITDRNGDGVQGIGVTADGSQDFNETTNENGCVVFGFIPAGDYRVKFNRAGYVDGDSNPAVDYTAKLTGGDTMKLQFDYDRGGTTQATFRTRTQRLGDKETFPPQIQFFNAAQPTPPKTFLMAGVPGTNNNVWNGASTPLFPFTSPYAVYGGNCTANIPPTSAGSQNSVFVNITPNNAQNAGTVYLPALDVRVMSGTPASEETGVANALVRYYPGCGTAWTSMTDSNGYVIDPGFPYTSNTGGGVLCVASPGSGGRRIAQVQPNVNYSAVTTFKMFLKGTGSKSGGWTGTASNFDCTA